MTIAAIELVSLNETDTPDLLVAPGVDPAKVVTSLSVGRRPAPAPTLDPRRQISAACSAISLLCPAQSGARRVAPWSSLLLEVRVEEVEPRQARGSRRGRRAANPAVIHGTRRRCGLDVV